MIGDSTMSVKPDTTVNPERGWGQMLPNYFKPSVQIHNHAVNGRSTRSFIDEGRWKTVLDALEKGDYLVIQFAHNDQKIHDPKRYTNPYTAYRRNLTRFVEEARAKGAVPILVSPVVRRKFNDDGVLTDTHGPYPLVMRGVAQEHEVPFVDMQQMSEDLVVSLGPERSKELYLWISAGTHDMYPDGKEDDTHFSENGATVMAGLFVDGIRGLGITGLTKMLK